MTVHLDEVVCKTPYVCRARQSTWQSSMHGVSAPFAAFTVHQ